MERLEEHKKEYGLNLDPDFQRGHVWSNEQRIAYLEFWLEGGIMTPMFFNWPVNMDPSKGYVDYVIVDGKQRLTTFTMFYNEELMVYEKYKYSDFSKHTLPYLYYVNNDLKTKKEVLEWYIFFNSGGTPHTKEEIDRVKDLLNKEL